MSGSLGTGWISEVRGLSHEATVILVKNNEDFAKSFRGFPK